MSFFEFLDRAGGFYYEVGSLSSLYPLSTLVRQVWDDSMINSALGRCTGALYCRRSIFAT